MSPMDELFNTISPEELAAAMDEVMWSCIGMNLGEVVEALKRMSRS